MPEDAGPRVLMHPARPLWLVGNASTEWIADALLAAGGEVEPVAAAMVEHYGISLEAARRDARSVRESLQAQGMLDGPAPQPIPTLQSLFLMLTERCNLACSHCYGAFPARQELALETVLRLVDELVEAGGTSLTLSGGEPLIYRELEPLVKAIGRRLPVQFLTNGILITEARARFLAEHLDASFQVSLDGPTPGIHDAIRGPLSYEGAMRGIHHLQQAGLAHKITLATTIQRNNHQALDDLVRLASELGIPKLRFLPLRKEGRAQDTWDCTGEGLDVATYERIFDRILENPAERPKGLDLSCGLSGFGLFAHQGGEHWCTVGRKLVVDPSGGVYPCAIMMGEDFRLGSIHRASLAEVLVSPSLNELRAAVLGRKERISGCVSCLWRNFCDSGCMGLALEEKGTIWDVDGLCDYRQRAYARAFDGLLARLKIPSARG